MYDNFDTLFPEKLVKNPITSTNMGIKFFRIRYKTLRTASYKKLCNKQMIVVGNRTTRPFVSVMDYIEMRMHWSHIASWGTSYRYRRYY